MREQRRPGRPPSATGCFEGIRREHGVRRSARTKMTMQSGRIQARRSETPQGERVFERERKEGKGKRGSRIRCPRCAWEPERDSTWMCSCLHLWNTFDTGGTCPRCGRQWLETQCLRCHQWSPHRDWYADDEGGA
jgi:hypothetical protein